MFRILLPVLLVSTQGLVNDNLKPVYEWKMLNFLYPSLNREQDALQSKKLVPEYNIPTGIEIFEDRLFVAIPRLKHGVAASLAFINMTETPSGAPELRPYPNWEAHEIRRDSPPQVVSPFKIRADRCARLWVLDAGCIDALEGSVRQLVKPRLVIYDLRSDQLLRSYTIPDEQLYKNDSKFVNIAVEDDDCQNSFAYLTDMARPGLVVYSYHAQKSWLVSHHYFNFNPLAGNMSVGGIPFVWDEGLFGLALSGSDPEGYSTLYFHPTNSFDEFSVSTKVLRNESLATNSTENFHYFKRLGTRGDKGQSGASFLDKKSNVLFFASIHLNAVMCWRTTNPNYTAASHGKVHWNNETMVYPSDVKVDSNDTLWVLSNKLPVFMYKWLDYSEINFRIMKAKVAEAIRASACDSTMVVNRTIVEKLKGMLGTDKTGSSSSNNKDKSSSSSDNTRVYGACLLVILVLFPLMR